MWGYVEQNSRRVAVYCASNPGRHPEYLEAARQLTEVLRQHQCDVVYGGAKAGAMGVIADAMLAQGGQVTGVLPRSLDRMEIHHEGLTTLHWVETMHERKTLMAELADGFIGLPGGFGTLEEIAEVLTWNQLGLHHKPVGLLNVRGFYDPLLQWMDLAVEERFIRPEHRTMVLVSNSPAELFDQMTRWQPPQVEKWLDREPR